jgi:hypothetical protein
VSHPSTAAQAKRAILDLLATSDALEGVELSWAGPTQDADVKHRMVWLGKTVQTEKWATSLGAKKRDEDYHVTVIAQVWKDGDDPEQTELKAWDLQSAVSEAIRADLTLGGLLAQFAELSSTEVEPLPASPRGWRARAEMKVHCVARI